MAFLECGIELEFSGVQEKEVAKVKACINPVYQLEVGQVVVKVDPQYYRPTEVELLIGNPTKANTKLNWKPKYDLPLLVKEMMESDLMKVQHNEI